MIRNFFTLSSGVQVFWMSGEYPSTFTHSPFFSTSRAQYLLMKAHLICTPEQVSPSGSVTSTQGSHALGDSQQ